MFAFVTNITTAENGLNVIPYRESHKSPTIELMEKYYANFNFMKQIFSIEVLKKAVFVLSFRDIAILQNVKEENMMPYIKLNYPVVNDKPCKEQFEEWKGEWHREYYANAYRVWVPSPYQHNYGKYVKKCLELTFPWFAKFNWNVYSLDKNNDWIYLDVDPQNKNKVHHSIYVPVSALFEKDINKIIETHTKYFKSYYGNDESRKEYLEEALSLLNSAEFKNLCKYLEKEE